MTFNKAIHADQILAENVDFETYLREFIGQHAEWIGGDVIQMPPVSGIHNEMSSFLNTLLALYLEESGDGKLRYENFTMRLGDRAREPDLLVVTTPHLDRLKETYCDGAADLVIEIVSPESFERDRAIKFKEYEAGGVREYWIIDSEHEEVLFYVRADDGRYKPHLPDSDGFYTSHVLPRLRFPAHLLIQQPAPTTRQAISLVEAMLA